MDTNDKGVRMPKLNRYVVGPDDQGRSAILSSASDPSSIQSKEGFYWRTTVWATEEMPPNNAIEGDRAIGIERREPAPGGMLYRALEIPPDREDKEEHKAVLTDLNLKVEQKHAPSAEDLARHPSMHRTDTLDFITCVTGEIYLVTDVDEVLMKPGDTVVIRGTNHAWSNRSDAPALLVGAMIDATQR
jgi:quercetin dioxygenase-like cupin family protein